MKLGPSTKVQNDQFIGNYFQMPQQNVINTFLSNKRERCIEEKHICNNCNISSSNDVLIFSTTDQMKYYIKNNVLQDEYGALLNVINFPLISGIPVKICKRCLVKQLFSKSMLEPLTRNKTVEEGDQTNKPSGNDNTIITNLVNLFSYFMVYLIQYPNNSVIDIIKEMIGNIAKAKYTLLDYFKYYPVQDPRLYVLLNEINKSEKNANDLLQMVTKQKECCQSIEKVFLKIPTTSENHEDSLAIINEITKILIENNKKNENNLVEPQLNINNLLSQCLNVQQPHNKIYQRNINENESQEARKIKDHTKTSNQLNILEKNAIQANTSDSKVANPQFLPNVQYPIENMLYPCILQDNQNQQNQYFPIGIDQESNKGLLDRFNNILHQYLYLTNMNSSNNKDNMTSGMKPNMNQYPDQMNKVSQKQFYGNLNESQSFAQQQLQQQAPYAQLLTYQIDNSQFIPYFLQPNCGQIKDKNSNYPSNQTQSIPEVSPINNNTKNDDSNNNNNNTNNNSESKSHIVNMFNELAKNYKFKNGIKSNSQKRDS